MSTLLAPFMRYICGGLAIALLIFIGLWKMEQNRAGRLSREVAQLVELRKSDRARYEAAQAEAERKNKETVRQIEEKHEQISDRSRSEYLRDLDRLRSQANRGSTSRPGVSQVPKATGGADPEDVSLSPEGFVLAQELELKCNALIDWVSEQMKVR